MKVTDPKVRGIIERYFKQELDDEALSKFTTQILQGGEWLFHQGDYGKALYFLVRGRLQVWVETESGNDGPSRPVGEVVPGETVGELSLLSDQPRSASIRAIRDSLLIRIDRESFDLLAERHPPLVMNLAANIAAVLQRIARGKAHTSRRLKTVCLLPLMQSSAIEPFLNSVVDGLAAEHGILDLMPRKLAGLGAPSAEAVSADSNGGGTLPDQLRYWLADQEDDHDFVIYRCSAGETAWSRFAVRQSDIVLLVTDASMNPEELAWLPPQPEGAFAADASRALILLQENRGDIRNTDRWLDRVDVDYHLHVEKGLPGDAQRIARIISGTATGLVVAGGAARGLAALGVFKALHEAAVPIDWVGGTSIGSIVAAGIALGWTPDEAIENSRKAFVKGKPFSDFTIPVYSLLRGKRMKRLLRTFLDYQIEDTAIPYFCVSTNLGRGIKNIHTRGSLVDAICASAALPGVIPPAVVNEELTVDGSLLDNLPVDVMQDRPVGRIIAVDVSSRVHYKVPFTEMPSPWAVLRGQWFPFFRKHRVPRLMTLMLKATEIGTLELSRRHGEMADLLIDPQVRQFGIMDVASFDDIVEAGYVRARELLEGWS